MRERRLIVYMKAADALGFPVPSVGFLCDVFTPGMDAVLWSVQIGHSLRSWCHRNDRQAYFYAQAIIAGIIARVPERDYRWNALVMDQLGISEVVLREYLAHGDSVLLANLIHIHRQSLRFDQVILSPRALEVFYSTISKFDIQSTLPGLQHDFCNLWNKFTLEGQNNNTLPYRVLRAMRHLYIALHQGTRAAPTAFSSSTPNDDRILSDPSSYPVCNIPDHRSHLNESVVGTTGETTPPTTM
jgi:hypothetical protein